jgi:hypothetical protein
LLENAVLNEYGGAFKCPGTRYVGSSIGPAQLHLYRVDDDVLIVELTTGSLRIIDNEGVEVLAPQATPWSDSEFGDLYVRGAFPGRLYFCHPDYEPRILRKLGDGTFRFGVLIFNDQDPVLDPRKKTISLSTDTNTDNDKEFISTTNFFIGDDLNSYWRVEAGWLEITEFVGAKVCYFEDLSTEYEVERPITTTDWTGPWRKTTTDNYIIDASGSSLPADTVSLTYSTPHPYTDESVGQIINATSGTANDFIATIIDIIDADTIEVRLLQGGTSTGPFSYSISDYEIKDRDTPDNSLISVTGGKEVNDNVTLFCTQGVFSPDMISGPGDDRNAVINFNEGQVRLTSVTNGNRANGFVKSRLGETESTTSWGQGWSPHTGFPTCVAEHQNRLMFAGFKLFPNLIIGSRTSKPQNFRQGGLDDDGLNITVSGDRNNRIRWIESAGDLLVGTEENEFALRGQPLTPTQLGVDLQHSYGGRSVPPQNVGAATLFVTTGSEIREMVFRFERDQYLAPDITILSRHLFSNPENPVEELEYVRDPDPLVFARHRNGDLRVLTYRRDDETGVVGWSRWDLQVDSMARVPRNGQEEMWFSVTRTINGQTVHYIEAMEPGIFQRSQVTRTAGGGVVLGLSHLEGERVTSRSSDGAYYGEQVVAGGRIPTPFAADGTQVEVGLPYFFRLSPQVLQTRDPRGDEPGRLRRLNYIRFQVFQSIGAQIKDTPITALAPKTDGTSEVLKDGWYERPNIGEIGHSPSYAIEQQLPFPFELVSVAEGDEDHGR